MAPMHTDARPASGLDRAIRFFEHVLTSQAVTELAAMDVFRFARAD
jgi:hypothetical protein